MYSYIKTINKKFWIKDKELHRWTNDLKPAVITNKLKQYFIQSKEYTKINDYLFNEDKIASIVRLKYNNKTCFTFLNDKTTRFLASNGTLEIYVQVNYHISKILHNYPGPAIVYPNGDEEYWIQGTRHRDDGPAVTIGNKHYYFRFGEFVKFETNPSKI